MQKIGGEIGLSAQFCKINSLYLFFLSVTYALKENRIYSYAPFHLINEAVI
jgi:hypothetical protein